MPIVTCTQCGLKFERQRGAVRERSFCDLNCWGKWLSAHNSGQNCWNFKGKIKKACASCGTGFEVYPSRHKQKFCSKKCCATFQRSPIVVLTCEYCGAQFERRERDVESAKVYCSQNCRIAGNSAGHDNPNYRGGHFVECDECGALTYKCPSQVREHCFCSVACHNKWQTVYRGNQCPGCGKEI